MKYFRLLFASLFRKKTRTILTMLSIFSAFLLFGLLSAVNALFNSSGTGEVASTRLVVQARTSFTVSLPLSMLPEIEAIPGVQAVSWRQWFGAVYQDSPNNVFGFAVPAARWTAMFPEWVMPEDQKKAFAETRTGIVVGKLAAERFGWKIGDKLPLSSNIFPKKDGSKDWQFDIVGIFDGIDDNYRRQTSNQVYINFDYFDEANQFGAGRAGIYNVQVAQASLMESVAAAIDARFLNSANETKSQTESEFQLGFARQIGDIGLIVTAILSAVMFTILLLTANTMMQSLRERIPELAVLKTLGFSDGTVLMLVLVEALLLVGMAGLAGMAVATAVGPGLTASIGFPPLPFDLAAWLRALGVIVAMALLVGLWPALRAQRLSIVDALAGR
ncbi:MAG: FtsX-like permease family protein [Lysobacterales bacterium]